MSKILVIGARGRAGAAAVAEARDRGHEVIGVARKADPSGPVRSAQTAAGDVTDGRRIAELAVGCDAVIAAVYDGGSNPAEFYPQAARALVEGLEKAGVPRLVWAGLASILPTADGTLLMDTEGYPSEFRSFFVAHQTARDIFAASSLDWVSVAPSGDFDHAGPARVGRYRVTPANALDRIPYVDFAAALIDEIDRPTYHREAIGVAV